MFTNLFELHTRLECHRDIAMHNDHNSDMPDPLVRALHSAAEFIETFLAAEEHETVFEVLTAWKNRGLCDECAAEEEDELGEPPAPATRQ